MLNARVVDNINGMQYDGILFERSKERKAPHNSYISNENILAGAEKVGASMEIHKIPIFSFYDSIEGAKIGDPVSNISIQYGRGQVLKMNIHIYRKEVYMNEKLAEIQRSIRKQKKPVEIANVIFMEIPHKTIDNAGRRELTLDAGGRAYLFQAGMMKVIEWENVDGILIPMENGVPAKLVPGKSWISFVPSNPGLENMVNYLP